MSDLHASRKQYRRSETAAAVLRLQVQIACGELVAMDLGKRALLVRIAEFGTISAAAQAMGLSYRGALKHVEAMNRCFAKPLVETKPGRWVGGARVTEEGWRVLASYAALIAQLDQAAQGPELAGILGACSPPPSFVDEYQAEQREA